MTAKTGHTSGELANLKGPGDPGSEDYESYDSLPKVTTGTHGDENGSLTYTGFNVSNLFGSTTPGTWSNFTINAVTDPKSYNIGYTAFPKFVPEAREGIQHMVGNLGTSIIASNMQQLFAKTMTDITIHSNYISAGKMSGLTDGAALAVDSSGGHSDQLDTYANYVKKYICSQKLNVINGVANAVGSVDSSVLTKKIAGPFLQDTNGLDVMGLENVTTKLQYKSGEYQPGPDWFFWQGMSRLDNPQDAFQELENYTTEYARMTNRLIDDFGTLNGFNNVTNASSGRTVGFTSHEMFDNFNNFIATLLENMQLHTDNATNDGFFFMTTMRQALKNENLFANLYLWARTYALGEDYQKFTGIDVTWGDDYPLPMGDMHGSGKENWYMTTKAFSQPDKDMFDNDPNAREKNYKRHSTAGGYGFGKDVSLASYCATELFYHFYEELLEVPKSYYKDDFNYNRRRQPTVNKWRNKHLIEGREDAGFTLGKVYFTENNLFGGPWRAYITNMSMMITQVFKPLFDHEENNELMGNDIVTSLHNEIPHADPNIDAHIIGLPSQLRKLINGGGAIYPPGEDGRLNLLTNGTKDQNALLYLNTNRKRTYGGFNSTSELRNLAKFSYFCNIMGRCLTFKLEMKENSNDLRYKYYKVTTAGLIAALRGKNFDEATMSKQSYQIARSEINNVKAYMDTHLTKCVSHLTMMKGQATSLRENLVQMRASLMGEGNSNINYSAVLGVFGTDEGGQLLQFLSKPMIASNTFSELVLMNSSKSYKHTPANDVFTQKQTKNMITYFSQPGYGFLTNENRTGNSVAQGRKSILHIGIPAGLIDELQMNSISRFKTQKYKDSNLILVEIHRTNVLDKTERTYSTPFVFDMSRFVIEDPDVRGINNIQLLDFTSQDAEVLKRKMCIFRISPTGKLRRYVGTLYPSAEGPPDGEDVEAYSQEFKKTAFTNHLTDHYLKMYCKVMLGLDFSEYIFQMSDLGRLTQGPSGLAAENILRQMSDANSKLFPEASTDISVARELDRLNRGIANSLYFNSEKYMHTTLYPNAFDRVFSVLINERDFMYKGTTITAGASANSPSQCTDDMLRYKSSPNYNLEGAQIVIDKLKTENFAPGPASYYERYNESILNKDTPQIYTYYCTVSLLPRAEAPENEQSSLPMGLNTDEPIILEGSISADSSFNSSGPGDF